MKYAGRKNIGTTGKLESFAGATITQGARWNINVVVDGELHSVPLFECSYPDKPGVSFVTVNGENLVVDPKYLLNWRTAQHLLNKHYPLFVLAVEAYEYRGGGQRLMGEFEGIVSALDLLLEDELKDHGNLYDVCEMGSIGLLDGEYEWDIF